jgi:UDP-glucose 4-epimerase
MKILVTGGAGYIGSHTIIDILENTNHEVVSIDNFSNSDASTFDRIKQITGKEVRNYELDLTAYQSLKERFFDIEGRIDGVIHFAALKAVGESVDKPVLYYHNNLNGLINLLKCVQKYGVRHLIFSSSCTVYGNTDEQPVTEHTPTQQTESPYGYTKLVGEKILEDFSKSMNGFSSISLRYFNPVGAHMSGLIGELPKGKPNNLVPIVNQFASGWLSELWVYGQDYKTRDGTAIRDYIHVSDVAHAHVLALESLVRSEFKTRYDVYNLGTGKGVTVLEVLNAFEEVTGIKLEYQIGPRRSGDVECIYADNLKATTELDWKLQYDILDAMRSAWIWQLRLNEAKHDDRVPLSES